MTSKIEVSREQLRQEFEWSAGDRAWFVHGGTVEDDTPEGFVYGDFTTDMCWTCYFEGRRKSAEAPEAPHQEPVCHVVESHLQALLAGDEIKVDAWLRHSDGGQVAKRTPLYAAPLSPDHSGGGAGVVFPDYQSLENKSEHGWLVSTGWNACLDKVKELNQ